MKKTLLFSIVFLFFIGKIQAQFPGVLTLTVSTTAANNCLPPCDGTATVAASGGTKPYTYIWNIPLNPQQTPTATGLCPGISYQVVVIDAGSPLPSQGQDVVTIACMPTGVNTILVEDNITLFPNPADKELTLEINSMEQGNAELVVRNVLGSVVYTEALQVSSHVSKQINISILPSGIYSVEFINREKAIRSKFIKQ
jgi:hypothetical protein